MSEKKILRNRINVTRTLLQKRPIESDFLKLSLWGGASDMSSDTHCATCHELVFLKLYLTFFSNTTCFYSNLEIILNKRPKCQLKKSDYSLVIIS